MMILSTTQTFSLARAKWWFVGYFWRFGKAPSDIGWVREARVALDSPLFLRLHALTLYCPRQFRVEG